MKTRTNSIVRFSALFLLLALFTMMLPVGAIDEPNTDPVSFKEAVHPDIYCDDSTTDGDNQTRQGEGYIVLTSSSWGVAVNYGFFTGTITLTNTLNYSSFSYPVVETTLDPFGPSFIERKVTEPRGCEYIPPDVTR